MAPPIQEDLQPQHLDGPPLSGQSLGLTAENLERLVTQASLMLESTSASSISLSDDLIGTVIAEMLRSPSMTALQHAAAQTTVPADMLARTDVRAAHQVSVC